MVLWIASLLSGCPDGPPQFPRHPPGGFATWVVPFIPWAVNGGQQVWLHSLRGPMQNENAGTLFKKCKTCKTARELNQVCRPLSTGPGWEHRSCPGRWDFRCQWGRGKSFLTIDLVTCHAQDLRFIIWSLDKFFSPENWFNKSCASRRKWSNGETFFFF